MKNDEQMMLAVDLFDKKKYNEALEILVKMLTHDPENEKAGNLAQTILSICIVKNPPERLRNELVYHHILDPFFAECCACGVFWVVDPLYRDVENLTIFNPKGGICDVCKNVFCADCSRKGDMLMCPQCHCSLKTVRFPNGRSRHRKKKEKIQSEKRLKTALLFKEPPGPADMKMYTRLVMETLCPEALSLREGVYTEMASGNVDQTYILMRTMMVKPGLDLKKYDVITQTFTDKDGGKGMIVKIYNK